MSHNLIIKSTGTIAVPMKINLDSDRSSSESLAINYLVRDILCLCGMLNLYLSRLEPTHIRRFHVIYWKKSLRYGLEGAAREIRLQWQKNPETESETTNSTSEI